ncbi:hypothetical protein AB0N09_21845 [Streptomyces erythrochromogenes]|uniref:hypothetical protein n=1 Tax=Streptomyces erythrochromogenes TaxID=285574 RepID=UPI00344715FF
MSRTARVGLIALQGFTLAYVVLATVFAVKALEIGTARAAFVPLLFFGIAGMLQCTVFHAVRIFRGPPAAAAGARTLRLLAYHRARAAEHPSAAARRRSERAVWRLAKRLPADGAIIQAHREQMTKNAMAAFDAMFKPRPADRDEH